MAILNVNDTAFSGTDSEVIQKTIDQAKTGDTVVVPRLNKRTGENVWSIAKAIRVKSGITLLLDNAVLVQGRGYYDNLITNEPGASDFRILGEGNVTLSGGEHNYLLESTANTLGMPAITKNAMFYFENASDFEVSSVRCIMPRWTTLYLKDCKNAVLSKIRFDMIPHVQRLRGIIIDKGCRDITLDTILGRTGEDTVFLKAMGDTDVKNIENIKMRNICTDSGRLPMIRIFADSGNRIQNIVMDTLMDSSDYYEKQRPAAAIAFQMSGEAQVSAAAPNPVHAKVIAKTPAKLGDIAGIRATGIFSRALSAVFFALPVSESEFNGFYTFGDIVYVLNGSDKGELRKVSFDRVYYGKGSAPNNLNQFIGRAAKGSVAVKMDQVRGDYEIKNVLSEEEN